MNSFTHGYALLIGVGESAYSPWSLPVTVRDAQAVRAILAGPGLCGYPDDADHLRLLHDAGATRRAILDGLAWLAAQAAADAQATAVVYYSGHGWLDQAGGDYYLIAHDVAPFDVAGSALAAGAFSEAIRRIAARRLLVIIDCCHAEGMAAAKEGPAAALPAGLAAAAAPKGLVEDLKRGEGRAVFTSCRGGQRSWVRPDRTMSIYTHHLLEALQGAGSRPGDTVVCLSNLMGHLGRAVPDSARRLCGAEQTPFFDAATEDFPVAVLRGGKGLPAGGYDAVQPEAERAIGRLYQATVRGSGAAAQGPGAQAAGERGVAGRDIAGPVVTGDGSAAAGGRGAATVGNGNIVITGDVQGGLMIRPRGQPGRAAGGAFPPAAAAGGYRLAAVKELLLAAFTAAELRGLFVCADNPALRPLVREFGEGDGLAVMANKAIEYCLTRDLLPGLLREVELANPQQYASFADQLRTEE